MIGAGISYYGQQGFAPNQFLQGNAKIYDGSFDYDNFLSFTKFERTQAFSVNINMSLSSIGGANDQVIFSTLISPVTGFAISITKISGLYYIYFQLANSASSRILVLSSTPIPFDIASSLIFTYNGSSLASGVKMYINNMLSAQSIVSDNLTGTIIPASNGTNIGQIDPTLGTALFKGKIRQLEIINRVATPTEIAAATSTGSFQGASISNSDYLLAVEFNKTGTVDLTTRASTPAYTITAVGGAAYTTYL